MAPVRPRYRKRLMVEGKAFMIERALGEEGVAGARGRVVCLNARIRTAVERTNARVKDEFGARHVRVGGPHKDRLPSHVRTAYADRRPSAASRHPIGSSDAAPSILNRSSEGAQPARLASIPTVDPPGCPSVSTAPYQTPRKLKTGDHISAVV